MIQESIGILYNIALLLMLVLGLPWWLFLLLVKPKFREGLGQRFLGISGDFAEALPAKPRIWIHAVSVGEVLAISGLVADLAVRAPEYGVVISTTTRTGQKLARERFGESRCFYFPFDLPWSVGATLQRIAPVMLLLAESELWPNVLAFCHRAEVPVVVVNARVSDRSLPRYLKLQPCWRPFLQMLTLVFSQTAQDADRLKQIGVPAERVHVGGNLKFDIQPPENIALTSLVSEFLSPKARVLVCGSTLDCEEAMLLTAWPKIVARVPNAVMVLAPRHPERFDPVEAILAKLPHAWVRRSVWAKSPVDLAAGSIFLLDSIGELASIYSAARVAFVGGSLVPAGGHNPLEPAQFGVAIAMGPYVENFRAIVELLVSNQAMVTVSEDGLGSVLTELLLDESLCVEMGRNAQRICQEQAGATARSAEAIVELLRRSERGIA